MGFREIKARILAELNSGTGSINHVEREKGKNLLRDERVTLREATAIIGRCQGTKYAEEKHDSIPGINVHIMKVEIEGKKWYIKFFFIVDKVYFVSFHT